MISLTLRSLFDIYTVTRDDLIASGEITFASLEEGAFSGDLELTTSDGESVGTVELNIEYEPGDGTCIRARCNCAWQILTRACLVNFFELMASRLHDSD